MKVIDDGIIKYDRTNFSQSPALEVAEYAELEYWRNKLYQLNLIGEYPNTGIGFGNISTRRNYDSLFISSRPQFIITGTQTGKLPTLDGNHYVRILDFSINDLKVTMQGPVEASSEVITHAAIYEHNPLIQTVFHIHSSKIWQLMINQNLPHTNENIKYGTLEMARATQACVGASSSGVFCMRGHEDGIIAYGTSSEKTWEHIFKLYERTN